METLLKMKLHEIKKLAKENKRYFIVNQDRSKPINERDYEVMLLS